jgi:hypothetical protein
VVRDDVGRRPSGLSNPNALRVAMFAAVWTCRCTCGTCAKARWCAASRVRNRHTLALALCHARCTRYHHHIDHDEARCFFAAGPHLCGDAMDVTDGRIVTTGSNRRYRALQQWDLGSGSLLHDVPWLPAAPDAPPCLLYAVRAGRPGGAAAGCVAAGGSGAAEVRVVCVDDHKTCSLACGAPLARLHGLPSAVYALAFDADETRLLVVCADAVRLALVPAA